MNITVAMDSFKGSLSSIEAGYAVEAGLLRAAPDAKIWVRPLADGGEGTCAALFTCKADGRFRETTVTGPVGTPVRARYILASDGQALMEMAKAAGLPLVPLSKRNPAHTTTYGLGEMILDAIGQGCRDFIIGIGGSATNDGGAGMLQALGFDLLDVRGLPIPRGGIGLQQLARIDTRRVRPELKDCRFRIACDVTNPLCGPNGCSAVYGPQKGADAALVDTLDRALAHFAEVACQVFPDAEPDFPGAGAAGGLGFAFRTFLNGTLCSGAELVLSESRLESYILRSDLVITGEGRLDGQTVQGKGPGAVAALAKKHGKPVIVLTGGLGDHADDCLDAGVDAYFPIVSGPCALKDALHPYTARTNLTRTAEQVLRTMLLFG